MKYGLLNAGAIIALLSALPMVLAAPTANSPLAERGQIESAEDAKKMKREEFSSFLDTMIVVNAITSEAYAEDVAAADANAVLGN